MQRVKVMLSILVIAAAIACAACSAADQPAPDALALPPGAPTLTVCEAASKSVGARVRVAGAFDGFGYGYESLLVVLKSDERCNDQGGGRVFATLRDKTERAELWTTHPGTQVIIEGTIDKVKEGRFVYLSDVIVGGES